MKPLNLVFRCATLGALAFFSLTTSRAANVASAPQSSTRWAETSASTSTLERGRVLLSIGDARALPMLRDVAQRALSQTQTSGPQNAGTLADDTLAACLWWGRAAQTFGARDESIQAWAQGLAVLNSASGHSRNALSLSLERDLRASLDTALRAGFPLRASDQTLQTLSDDVARGAWKPQRSTFLVPTIEYSNEASKSSNSSRELLVTSGNLPLSDNGGTSIGRTPSLYRSVDASTLPPALRMDRTLFGYVRDGASWRQIVRVLYAHDSNTQGRAEQTCLQFLRIWTVFNAFLGRSNTYANDGVTTVWMTTAAAEWPQKPSENWSAGAWIDSSPDQMILFRVGEARPAAEWLREVAHEYSHIAWPPFAGFQTPLEPFGNGRLGETLLMLWAAQTPQAFFPASETAQAQRNCLVHIERHALPALQGWLESDPRKAISTSGDQNALNQVLGLALEIERVYGADVLRRALDNATPDGFASWREAGIEYSMRRTTTRKSAILRANDLMRGFQGAMNQSSAKMWPSGNHWPIWLPGAIVSPNRSAIELAGRAPLKIKMDATVAAWIYVPSGAKMLRIFVQNASSASALLKVVGSWQATNARDSLLISVVGRAGWQRLELRATQEVTLSGARFERGAS